MRRGGKWFDYNKAKIKSPALVRATMFEKCLNAALNVYEMGVYLESICVRSNVTFFLQLT